MNRIDHERRTVEMMIRLYCRHKEGNETLCDNCRELMCELDELCEEFKYLGSYTEVV